MVSWKAQCPVSRIIEQRAVANTSHGSSKLSRISGIKYFLTQRGSYSRTCGIVLGRIVQTNDLFEVGLRLGGEVSDTA